MAGSSQPVPTHALNAWAEQATLGELDKVSDQACVLREWFRGFVRKHMGPADRASRQREGRCSMAVCGNRGEQAAVRHQALTRPILAGSSSSFICWTEARMRLSLYARATSRWRELCRPNAPIQSPMARPISSGDGDLPGPGQCRASSLARGGERPPIRRHLLVGELTQDGFRQDFFNEIVVLQDHRLAGLGSERLQGRTHAHLVPMVPALRRNDRLHERDTLHGLAMAIGPVEAEGRAPVVDDQGDPLAYRDSSRASR